MSSLLLLETATAVCSVGISRDNKLVSLKESHEGFSHAEKLTRFIEEACKEAKFTLQELDAIVVSSGPGSYTGLRIGVSTAKGLCFALDKPLIAVPTLAGIATGMQKKWKELKMEQSGEDETRDILFIPMIDARRMEVYQAIYSKDLSEIQPASAEIIEENSFGSLLNDNQIFLGGDGSAKLEELFSRQKDITIWNDVLPSAANLLSIAEVKFKEKHFENTSLFEPFYLKEYIPGRTGQK